MTWLVQNLWLIPALPLLAAGVTALAKRPQRRFAATLAIGSMILAFALSCVAFVSTLGSHIGTEVERRIYTFNWFQFGDAWLRLGWVLDPLTAVMLVMVTLVGLLIFIYSVGYMAHDENVTRFFCFLSLFAAAMLGLVIGDSLLLFFICWELVGLSSYLLIGFWYHKPSAAAAAKKAFIVTRVGDIGFFLGILWLYAKTGTLLFYDNGNGCLESSALTKLVAQTTSVGLAASTGISLLIFCGAIGKSGQVPLHVWLPDAMEGPTPVSALIHAATMVAAGVFLVARVYPLMAATPENVAQASSLRINAASLPRVGPVELAQTLGPFLAPAGREVKKPARNGSETGANEIATAAKIDHPLPEPQKVAQASCLFGADRLEACPTLQPAARFMAPTHVRILEVFALPEPRSSRREEAHYSKSEIRNLKSEIDESLLTSAAAFHGRKARNFLGKYLPGGEGRGGSERSSEHHPGTVTSIALRFVTWVGAITAVFAALIAVAQTDIKRILAYSTVSQLGYMMMGLGVGGVAVGMFHLITHAFFKALLFMGAGSVIHGCHDEQDIRRMCGLRKFMPVTFATYAVGMMALCGVPIFFSGFWSKDEILHAAHAWPASRWPFYLGLFGALLTGFYMTRQVCYVFFGESRAGVSPARSLAHDVAGNSDSLDYAHPPDGQTGRLPCVTPHESPGVMTWPLIILACFAVLLGFIGTPAWPWFQSYLRGDTFAPGFDPETVLVMSLSTLVVAAGIAAAGWLYGRKPAQEPEAADPLERWQPSVFAMLRQKFYVDDLYDATVVRFNANCSRFCHWLDATVLDTLVWSLSYLVLGLSWLNRVIDEYVVNLGFDAACRKLRNGGGFLSRLQDGQVHNYLRVLGLALTVFLLLLTWGCGK